MYTSSERLEKDCGLDQLEYRCEEIVEGSFLQLFHNNVVDIVLEPFPQGSQRMRGKVGT